MIYIKSTLVGIVTVVLATIVYIAYAFFVMMRTYTPPPGTMVALDLRTVLRRPTYGLIALAALVLGFYWEFRRAI